MKQRKRKEEKRTRDIEDEEKEEERWAKKKEQEEEEEEDRRKKAKEREIIGRMGLMAEENGEEGEDEAESKPTFQSRGHSAQSRGSRT